eukprot:scaffold4536_cov164-Skeletonema_dohrnii-CCMP3373.AAC.5
MGRRELGVLAQLSCPIPDLKFRPVQYNKAGQIERALIYSLPLQNDPTSTKTFPTKSIKGGVCIRHVAKKKLCNCSSKEEYASSMGQN